jgi:hypothetical protein
MANDFKKLYSRDNLRRAWRWINTDPSYKYKNFFRDIYSSYSFAIEENLKDLSERLKLGTYDAKVVSTLQNLKCCLPMQSIIQD